MNSQVIERCAAVVLGFGATCFVCGALFQPFRHKGFIAAAVSFAVFVSLFLLWRVEKRAQPIVKHCGMAWNSQTGLAETSCYWWETLPDGSQQLVFSLNGSETRPFMVSRIVVKR